MRRLRLKLAVGVAAPLLATSVAIACGPFFPLQLLDHRSQAIAEAPANSFAFEAAHLLPTPADSLRYMESDEDDDDEDATLARIEGIGLNEAQRGRLVEIRKTAANGQAAFDTGEGLPDAVRLYVAGAVDFRHGNKDGAARSFAAVLALPADASLPRATWATYMLGRLKAEQGDVSGAAAMFAASRQQTLRGASDPLNLAIASYGAQAKLYLDRARAAPDDEAAMPTFNADLVHAVNLYGEQAARGSDSGVQSLRIIAANLLGAETTIFADYKRALRWSVREPLIQRLLAVYLLARPYLDEPETPQSSATVLADALETANVAIASGAGRLASFAYSQGRYALAERFAARETTPLSTWIKAKLASQRGDTGLAASLTAEAAKSFTPGDNSLTEGRHRRTLAESGVLLLATRDYETALRQLLAATQPPPGEEQDHDYWSDAAHIAERVLTVDELKQFVDREVPSTETRDKLLIPEKLRDLLARRLARAGRYKEALAYYRDPEIAQHTQAYALAVQHAETAWFGVTKADAYFEAALLARSFGMEMMGTEGEPDYFSNHGALDFGEGASRDNLAGANEDEAARFEASGPTVDRRFHYRFLAVELAGKAADHLPPRSQAFAAVLCTASGWMRETHEAEADYAKLYQRYVKQGPLVPWAVNWGHECPVPDFDRARVFGPRIWAERLVRRTERLFRF